jgi:hypothetical protein
VSVKGAVFPRYSITPVVFSVAVTNITAKSGVAGRDRLFSINPNQNSFPVVDSCAYPEVEETSTTKRKKRARKIARMNEGTA